MEKKKKKQILELRQEPEWYNQLVLDLKKIQFETIVKGKWMIGKRILEEEGKPEYGEETIEQIAKDLGVDRSELFRCIQFAQKVDDPSTFIGKSWDFIRKNILPTQKKELIIQDDTTQIRLNPYDSNMFYFTKPLKFEEEYDDDILCIDVTHGKDDIRIYKEYYPTITTQIKLTDKNGKEFTLRQYAKIQDFPSDFKFVGNQNEIKRQIGEAVSPKMSEYILNKHIKGKTYIELFAGCGGFSIGAYKLGKKCIWCNDFNRYSTHSFKLNFPETEVNGKDVKNIKEKEIHKKIGDIDFIMGGPPCQGFSKAGKRLGFKEDERNSLYLDYLRFVKEFRPKQFIMENVEGIEEFKDEIINDFEKIGYSVDLEKVNGLDIGMKQKRIRVFFIGRQS